MCWFRFVQKKQSWAMFGQFSWWLLKLINIFLNVFCCQLELISSLKFNMANYNTSTQCSFLQKICMWDLYIQYFCTYYICLNSLMSDMNLQYFKTWIFVAIVRHVSTVFQSADHLANSIKLLNKLKTKDLELHETVRRKAWKLNPTRKPSQKLIKWCK